MLHKDVLKWNLKKVTKILGTGNVVRHFYLLKPDVSNQHPQKRIRKGSYLSFFAATYGFFFTVAFHGGLKKY